jgi:hypothetical protein
MPPARSHIKAALLLAQAREQESISTHAPDDLIANLSSEFTSINSRGVARVTMLI